MIGAKMITVTDLIIVNVNEIMYDGHKNLIYVF